MPTALFVPRLRHLHTAGGIPNPRKSACQGFHQPDVAAKTSFTSGFALPVKVLRALRKPAVGRIGLESAPVCLPEG
jgi:hypothetical protein